MTAMICGSCRRVAAPYDLRFGVVGDTFYTVPATLVQEASAEGDTAVCATCYRQLTGLEPADVEDRFARLGANGKGVTAYPHAQTTEVFSFKLLTATDLWRKLGMESAVTESADNEDCLYAELGQRGYFYDGRQGKWVYDHQSDTLVI